MIEHELNRLWKGASAAVMVKLDKTKLLYELQAEREHFGKAILQRDRREILVALLLVPVLLAIAWFIPFAMSKFAMTLLAIWCLVVVYMLRSVKKHRVKDNSLPLKEYLMSYRNYIAAERNLLKNVLYWYVLPPIVLGLIFLSGFPLQPLRLTFIAALLTGLGIFIYVLNQRSVKNDFDPLLEKLSKNIRELSGENT